MTTASASKRAIAGEASPCRFERRVEGVEYEILDSLVGFAVRRALQAGLDVFARIVGPTDFTPQRFHALVIVEQNPGLTQTRLGRILGIARSGVMLLVDFHEAAGYVVREPSATDGRAYGLRITPAGRRRLADVKRLMREVDRRATAALTADEKRRLVELLAKVGDVPENAGRPAGGGRRAGRAAKVDQPG